MMSYIDLNWDFSQFDRDNMNRFLAAAYTSNANRSAAAVLADPDAAKALGRLRAAHLLVGAASSSFSGHRYLRASVLAAAAYREVVAAARMVGVPVASSRAGTTTAMSDTLSSQVATDRARMPGWWTRAGPEGASWYTSPASPQLTHPLRSA
jgi:hypothetical protein